MKDRLSLLLSGGQVHIRDGRCSGLEHVQPPLSPLNVASISRYTLTAIYPNSSSQNHELGATTHAFGSRFQTRRDLFTFPANRRAFGAKKQLTRYRVDRQRLDTGRP